ncbi:L-threonylcarbamoyladenylate synthase [Candidatus Nitrospira bockiana]
MALILPLEAGPGAPAAREAEHVLRRGGVLAVPTESFYALAASPFDARAVDRVAAIKGRPGGKPILILISRREQLAELVAEVPEAARVLMDRFWPGPLTLIMPAAAGLPSALSAGTGTVGVRLVDRPDVAALLERVGPLTGTSANRSGETPARTAAEVHAALGAEVDLILEAAPGGAPIPSTVVDTRRPVKIVREGPVKRADIVTALAASAIVVEEP